MDNYSVNRKSLTNIFFISYFINQFFNFMKFSLRNSILAIAALAMAGTALAQTPTLTKVWEQKIEATPARDHSRFATGFDGNLYVINKENGEILKFNADGVSVFATVEGVGTAITSDDAGNILVNKGFPDAGSFGTWVIIEPNGTQHDLAITAPEGMEAARTDQVGRVVGNVMSEEGAWMYLAPNGATNVAAIKIANGAQDEEASMASPSVSNAMNTSTLCQPMLASVEDVEAAADPSATFYARNRSDNKVWGWSEDGSEQLTLGTVGAGGNDGFDCFVLNDVLYAVASSERATDKFMIKNLAENEVVEESAGENAPSNAYFFRAYTVRKISDDMVGIYAWCPGNGGAAAYYTYGIEPAAELYILGQVNGKEWAANDGVKMELSEGNFVADVTLASEGSFAFSPVLAENNDQGGWDYIRSFRLGPEVDGTEASTEAANALFSGADTAFKLPAGEYTFSVKEDYSELTVTKKGEPVPTYPDELYILGEVNENTWAPNVGLVMTPADSKSLTGEFIATFTADGRNDGYNYFSFTEKLAESAEDWGAIAGYRYGADANDKEVVLDEAMAIQKGENAYKIAAGEYNVEVNLSAGTVKFSAVPVVGPSAPVINPNGGEFENEVTVTITAEVADEIRYTLDGETPTIESALYAEPIVLNEVGTHTVKAIAIKNGLVSDAVSAEFTITNGGGGGGEAKLEVIIESKENIIASGDGRFSTGFGDYIYLNDKANAKVVRYDKTGARSDYAEVEGLGTAITSDDAGNILVNKGFPGATSATDWVIIEPDGTQHALALEFPAAVTAAREDVAGRVIGDVMSSDGAYLFLAVNTAQNVVAFKIANGAQDGDAVESPAAQFAFDNTTVARARYESVEEIDAAADPSTAVVYRKRGNLKVYGWDEEGSEIVDFGAVEGARSCEGFDIFKIGDIYYSVEPSTDTNYADGFAIRELGKSENIVTKEKTLFAGGSQRFQSLTARVMGDCAIIYQNVSGEGIGMYKFTPAGTGVNTIGNDADVVATAYYNLQGVRVNNPSAGQILIKVNTLSNGSVSASKVLVR